jgi:Kef-type K+ transport system membrane component KefB
MKLGSLRAVARSLGWITLVKGSLILAMITATVFAARPLIPFLAAASAPLVLAVGLIFGVLAIGTSPAATIAVINETQSRGRLSDITLGVAVAKDVVMVVLLAIAISLAKLFSTPGASFDPTTLVAVSEELLLSVAVGALLGAIIIAYLRFVRAERWLFIVALIFLNTVMAERFHLETLLVFIVAGFVVQNFSRYGDEFIHPIEEVSLPVYVVFFSIAGAGLDLQALRQVWLIALMLVAARAVAIFVGTRLAVTLARENAVIKSNAWLGFITQAGVVLGLSIIVENNLPGLGQEIKTVVLGTIGLNLMLGPITFKTALVRAGETKEAREQHAAVSAATKAESIEAESLAAIESLSADDRYPRPEFVAPELNDAALKLRAGLIVLQRECEQKLLDPQTTKLRGFVAHMREQCLQTIDRLQAEAASLAPGEAKRLIRCLRGRRLEFSRWLQEEIHKLVAEDGAATAGEVFRECLDRLDALAAAAKESILAAQEPERFLPLRADSFYVRSVKRLKRWRRRARRFFGAEAELKRAVEFRRLLQYHCAVTLPPRLPRVANLINAQTLLALRISRSLYDRIDRHYEAIITAVEGSDGGRLTPSELSEQLKRARRSLLEKFDAAATEQEKLGATVKKELTTVLAESYEAILKDLALAGTFELPRRRYRYPKGSHA